MSDRKLLQAILSRVASVDEKVTGVDKKVDKAKEELLEEVIKNGKRIDNLGIELAELSDDAPTRDEHDALEKRVGKIEKQVASN